MRAPKLAPAVAFAAIAAGLGSRPAAAAFPDWAQAVANPAPSLPEGVPEWPERTLLEEVTIAVSSDGGTWKIRERRVVQVLSNRVDETQFGAFSFDDTMKVKKAKGWHIPPDSHAERSVGGAIDLSLSDEFLTDAHARVVALEGVKRGSLLAYEFDAESHPYTLTTSQSFFEDVPVALARWSIDLPDGWGLKHAWLPGSGPEPAHSGTTWTFERRDLMPVRSERLGQEPSELGPRLVVALQPPPGATPPVPAFADWAAVGRWYQDLSKGRDAPSPQIDAAIKEATAKAGPQPLDRIRAVALVVRDRVRYLAREVGIGGYQPHYASQVFTELYGDCKDKGTLLRAALGSAGFTTYPIIIHATNPNTVAPEVPAPGSFDHFVIGVRWPKDQGAPPEGLSALVDVAGAGPVLVLDPTDERAWPGTLPDNLAGKTGLLVVDGQGVLVTLPQGAPGWNRVSRVSTIAVAGDRSATVKRVTKLYGGPAESARHSYAKSAKDERDDTEQALREAWPGAQIKDYAVTPEDTEGAYVETVSLTLPPGAPALQENAVWVFSGATADIARVPLGRRATAVVYPYPVELKSEVTVTGIPATDPVPEPQKASGDGWAVESSFDRADGGMRGKWSATLSRTRFEPAAFPELKQFWSAASKAATAGLSIAP